MNSSSITYFELPQNQVLCGLDLALCIKTHCFIQSSSPLRELTVTTVLGVDGRGSCVTPTG